MRINYACGKMTLDGYINIDAQDNPKAKRALDIKHIMQFTPGGELIRRIPLEDRAADEIICYHFIEHVYRWEADAVIREFKRLLKPGGKLILELPNLELACRNLIKGGNDQMSRWPIYGDWNHKDPLMMHKHGYTPRDITELLESMGMSEIEIMPPMTHGKRANRDMRVECLRR